MLILKIPYKDKEKAKILGAKWNPNLKSWYVNDKFDYPIFREWILHDDNNKTIICDHVGLIQIYVECPHCLHATKVLSPCFDNYYVFFNSSSLKFPYLYFDKDLIFSSAFISQLNQNIIEQLESDYSYYLDYSANINAKTFLNHCDDCERPIENDYLFSGNVYHNFSALSKIQEDRIDYKIIELNTDIILDGDHTNALFDY